MALTPTRLQYYQDPYQTTLQTKVVGISSEEDWVRIFLEETIFFPQGGGQPSDQGVITGPAGRATVLRTTMQDGVVCHWTKLEGHLNENDQVTCQLDWDRRFWYMRVHTAGHLVHDALMELVDGLTPQRGEHGDNPYVKYKGLVDDAGTLQQQLEESMSRLIAQDHVVMTEEATVEELSKRAKFVSPNLPEGKPLRILQISGFDAMPDGGVHVKKLGELGQVSIPSIRCKKKKGSTTVKYEVS